MGGGCGGGGGGAVGLLGGGCCMCFPFLPLLVWPSPRCCCCCSCVWCWSSAPLTPCRVPSSPSPAAHTPHTPPHTTHTTTHTVTHTHARARTHARTHTCSPSPCSPLLPGCSSPCPLRGRVDLKSYFVPVPAPTPASPPGPVLGAAGRKTYLFMNYDHCCLRYCFMSFSDKE